MADLIDASAQALGAYGRMLGAAAGDIAETVTRAGRGRQSDPFDRRDPAYIRATLPALRLSNERYHRAEVHGLEHIPAEGPVLLVGNHSGGTMIVDTFAFSQAFIDHFGVDRPFFQLAHDLVFKVPGLRTLVERYGTVPASPENMRRALDRDAALLVYPGGDHESYRPTWESAKIDFAGRRGFVRLALETGVRIVPVVAIGGQETGLFLGQGRRIAQTLRLDRTLRLKVLPAVVGPPIGPTVLDLPPRVPLPSKITIRVLEPIDLRERLGGDEDAHVREGYDLVTELMQQTLTDLAEERTLPVLG